jgi:hypothetical protein
MTRFLAPVLAVLAGLIVGIGSALLVLGNGQLLGRSEKDYWFGNKNAGAAAADPYTRGIVANIGLLAMNRNESVYFHRYKDDHGAPLHEGCVYEMKGGKLPARWWSVTIYAADEFLPMNKDQASSLDATRIAGQADGTWTARLADDQAGAANWISTRSAGTFSLSLRMYNPEDAARDDPMSIDYPSLKLLSCTGGST